MANEQNVSETVLSYKVTGVREATQSALDVKRSQQQLTAELDKLSPASRRNVDSVRRDFATMKSELEDARRQVAKLESDLDSLGNKRVTPTVDINDRFDQVSRNVALAGDAQSNLGALSGLAGAAGFGGASQGLGLAGEVIVLVEELPRLKVALQGLPAAAQAAWDAIGTRGVVAFGLAGVAVGAAALAFSEVSRQAEETRKRIEAFSSSLGDIATRAGGGATSEQLREELSQRQREQASIQEQIERLGALRDRANELTASVQLSSSGSPLNTPEFAALQAVNDEIKAITGGSVENFSQLGAVIDTLRGKSNDLTPELAAINVLLGSTSVAANDAAVALAAQQQQEANVIQQSAQARLQAEQFAATATNDSVNARIEAYQNENRVMLDANSALLASGTEAALAIYSQNLAQIALNNTHIEAVNAIRGEVAARQALNTITTGANSLVGGIIDGIQALPKATADFKKEADAVAAALKKVEEEEARHRDTMSAIRADLAEKETSILTDAREKAGDLGDKFGIERERAEEDLQDALARIRQRGALGEQQAAQARNVVAFDQARTQAQQEESEAESQADKLERRREQDYRRELQQLVIATNKRLTEQRDAAQKAINLEVQRYNAEISVRQQGLTAAQNQFAQYMNDLLGVGASGYPAANAQFNTFLGNIQRALAGAQQQAISVPSIGTSPISGGGTGGGGGSRGIQPITRTAATGGWREGLTLVNDGTGSLRGTESALMGNKGILYFDRPTRILNAQETAAMRGGGGVNGNNFNFNISGPSWSAVRNEMNRQFDEFVQGFEETALVG